MEKQTKNTILRLDWRFHTPNFLKEIDNIRPEGIGIFKQPVIIFRNILGEIANRCSELNDPKLNALMCILTLYEIADPDSKEYNPKLLSKTLKEGGSFFSSQP